MTFKPGNQWVFKTPHVEFTPEMVDAIVELRSDGNNLVVIADKIGVDVSTLRNWRRRTGFVVPPLPCGHGWSLGR